MNALLITMLCVGVGPCSSAIEQALNSEQPAWETISLTGSSLLIELPKVEAENVARIAPDNYKMPMPTKAAPAWCPAKPEYRHGYSCGMQKAVEDLASHLQEVHGVSLEQINTLKREGWQDLHDNIHWEKEPEERKDLFLNPRPVKKSSCPSGNCPSRVKGFF